MIPGNPKKEKKKKKHPFTLPRPYLSPSQISSFLMCSERYMMKYILGIAGGSSVAALQGSGVHKGLELSCYNVIQGGEHLTPAQATEFAVEYMEDMADDLEDFYFDGEVKDDAVEKVEEGLGAYLDYVAPYIEPVSTEAEIWYESPCGVDVMGYIDLTRKPTPVERELFGNEDVVVDYKTSAKKWAPARVKDSLQFMVYARATGVNRVEAQNIVLNGRAPDKINTNGEGWALGVQDIATTLRIMRAVYPEEEFTHLDRMIEAVARQISAGIFTPCAQGEWWCSEKFCDYWHLCRGKK